MTMLVVASISNNDEERTHGIDRDRFLIMVLLGPF
jgi:hypothetical protein